MCQNAGKRSNHGTEMQNFSYVQDNHYLSKIIGSVHALINQAGTAKIFKTF